MGFSTNVKKYVVMFITKDDYVNIASDALSIVEQSDDTKRETAEKAAQEEIAGYLRGVYDTDAIFAATGDNRNPLIVMVYCDITLYHLICSRPQKMGYDLREKRYDYAISVLKDIQSGKLAPNLPHPASTTDPNQYNKIQFDPGIKNNYFW